ncbi:hypothetical protein EBI01_12020 [Marinomonas rhizomae]|uniref:Uncharacterized protein n=1 Tax=Marinomonas rhizomae TaxID=491948 RepID=A0A366J850_9GAMM|nr:hypothetical protein [Marinomonas rhizomae]RBP83133.1 hypothetical protein DFP80_107101 [Marinomonas rhizomae]RNF72566.1 hypothetical protein EBI01_12020 [Marinomonas rhizomae]
MGLILGPLLLFWIMAAGFSIYIGNALLEDGQSFIAYLIAIITTLVYVLLSFLIRFGNKKELWVFEIPFFFMTNKISLFLYGVSIFFYVWGDALKAQEYGNEMIFILNFTLAFSAIIGTFSNDIFIKSLAIKRTH